MLNNHLLNWRYIMTKSKKIVVITLLAVGMTGAAFAFGSQKHFGHSNIEDKKAVISYMMTRKLDLNEAQIENLNQLTDHVATLMQQAHQQRQAHHQLLDQLLSDQPLDQNLILEKITEKTDQLNKNAPEIVALLGVFVDSLDTEQKAELKSHIEQHHGRHGG